MSRRSFRCLLALSLLVLCCSVSQAQETKAPATNTASAAVPSIESADQLYESGKFLEASQQYQALLKTNPDLIAAQTGTIRSYLKLQMVKPAFEVATSGLAKSPLVAPLHSAMGDVQFRRGEMAASELEYKKALELNKQDVRAMLGLSKIYRAFSLYRRSYDLVKSAHDIAPDDADVRLAWMSTLSRSERIKALQEFLKSPKGQDAEEKESLEAYLTYLSALQEHPKHNCELVTKLESTETEMKPLLIDARRLHGWGLVVQINDQKSKLALDTGASGLVISRRLAEKSGVVRISSEKSSGIGDKGSVNGYTAYAERIKVGELEFHDCVVDVIDRRSVVDDDGLIGADVFGNYLVNIDFPGNKLKLSPLPKRPEDSAPSAASLNTSGDKDDEVGSTKEGENRKEEKLPRDRYVAPEMQNWSRVFRFGHMLLIPTKVNDGPSKLFLIDTGAFSNVFTPEFAKEITKVRSDETMRVKGISGYVNQVYSADKSTLQFGHLRQANEDTVTFDLSNVSRHTGAEVSGILGYATMAILELKIDYRDGLVDFVYDAKRTHTENFRTK